jgi:hypothetical protein
MSRLKLLLATAFAVLWIAAVSFSQDAPRPTVPVGSAAGITYDNTNSGLASVNQQDATDELASLIADGTGVVISNRATGGMIFNQCDEGVTSGIEVLAGDNAAFVTFYMSVDGSEQGYFKVEDPWPAYDYQLITHTLWPASATPALTTTMTSGLFDAALSTDAAAFNVAEQGTADPITVFVGAGQALHIYSPVNNCWTVDMGFVVAEVAP